MKMMSSAANRGLAGFGIVIESEPMQQQGSRKEYWLRIIAQLPDEGDHELNARWVRSLFLTCVSEANQSKVITNLLKGRVLFASDVKKIPSDTPMIRFSLRLNLAQELNRKLLPDRYYVQVSARQFLSNSIVVECV